MKFSLASLSLVSSVLATSRTSAPSGCITVAKSGATYKTIQSAVDSLSTTSSAAQCIFIKAGTYDEQVLVPKRAAQLTVYGATADTTTYSANTVTITQKRSQLDGYNNDNTAALRVKSVGFKLYNVNVENTYGKGSQAVALSAYADSGYYGCAFTGFQDTLLSEKGNQVYVGCQITGATDFIFGQTARTWFEKCDLRVVAAKQGYLTANGNDGANSEYVFNKCDVAAATGQTVTDGAYFLGRPWGPDATVVFQYTTLSSVINPAGWSVWSKTEANTSGAFFAEFKNSGAGSKGTRATFSRQLSASVSLAKLLGSNYKSQGWFDAAYFAAA